jgi:carbohydrate kinase (thermoresistant glucokinase family)
MTVVIMGVCGCGKTTIGRALADELGWDFLDADEYHPEANVAKMAAGAALTDDDRWPWLDRLSRELRTLHASGRHAILACSALRQIYRDRLAAAGELKWVYLKGDLATIEPRLASRRGHFMPPSLLASQFAALEEPAAAMVVDIRQSVATQVAQIASGLRATVPNE